MPSPLWGEGEALLRRLMGAVLHLRVDELQRRRGLFQHAPALQPVVGALHLVGRDWRRIANDETALAQILDLERRDLRILLGVIVDEVVHVRLLVGVDAAY